MSGYTRNVPLPNQTISGSQSPIETNFQVIDTAFAVDHTAMITATNQGEHQKVSLVQQSGDPLAIPTTPILFSKQVAYNLGVNRTELFMKQASGDGGAAIQITDLVTSVINNPAPGKISGSTFLPNGLILKYGQNQTATNGGNPITFSFLGIPDFNQSLLMVVASPVASPNAIISVSNYGPGGFTATTNLANALFNFIAIGI